MQLLDRRTWGLVCSDKPGKDIVQIGPGCEIKLGGGSLEQRLHYCTFVFKCSIGPRQLRWVVQVEGGA